MILRSFEEKHKGTEKEKEKEGEYIKGLLITEKKTPIKQKLNKTQLSSNQQISSNHLSWL